MLEIALLEGISQNFQKTKDFFTETAGKSLNSVTEVTEKAKTSLSETAGNAKDTITQTSNQAFSNFTESTNKAVESVSGIPEKAKGAFSETTTKAATTINETANKAFNSFTEATDKAKALNRSFSEGIQGTISSSLNVWISDHPRLVWLLNHPLQTAGILLLIIFLFSGLLKAISGFTEKLWLFLLQAPFKLIQFIFGLGSKSLGKVKANGLVATKNDPQERMTNILSRLDKLKQEQDLLLQELATLIKSENLKSK